MKIDRRSFLAFSIGGAAGTALTPLPWKLQDDLSIWSQMWPWTPVPEDGEISYNDATCTLCSGGCGITVRKAGNRAIKIEGKKDHPINNGGVCILGLSGLQLLYGQTRVKTPLKRVGKRGQGKWEKISWESAIAEVSKKMGDIRAKGESHTACCISGSEDGVLPNVIKHFLTSFGSPNFIKTPSINDAYTSALRIMHGIDARPAFDFENSDFILSFGSGIIDGWGSPVRMFKANSIWKQNNAKIKQIEPRLSNTAAKSDEWIPINPGTEAQLALGIAHVIITNPNYNNSFIQNYTSGFETFKNLVIKEYTPEKVSKVTGVEVGIIESLAKDFKDARNPVAICGRGQGKSPGSVSEFMAVHALNALVGAVNNTGGVFIVPDTDSFNWPKPMMDPVASNGMRNPRIDGANTSKYSNARHLLTRLSGVLDKKEGYPVNALFVSGANPLYTLPDAKAVKKAFDGIPFIVSFSSYMDETAQNADLILPHHVYLERYQDVPTPLGLSKPVIGMSKPVVAPLFNTKNTGDVIIEISKAIGGSVKDSFPWESYEACLEDVYQDKWDQLNGSGLWEGEKFTGVSGTGFALDSFKIDAIKPEGDEKSFPLTLIPYDSMRLANGVIGAPPFVIKTVSDRVLKGNDIFVEINPVTAKGLGLAQGKFATLTTPKGSAKVRIDLCEGIKPGVVAMARGLGHTAYDEFLANKGVNINDLIGSIEDPGSGLDAAWGIRAKLAKA